MNPAVDGPCKNSHAIVSLSLTAFKRTFTGKIIDWDGPHSRKSTPFNWEARIIQPFGFEIRQPMMDGLDLIRSHCIHMDGKWRFIAGNLPNPMIFKSVSMFKHLPRKRPAIIWQMGSFRFFYEVE